MKPNTALERTVKVGWCLVQANLLPLNCSVMLQNVTGEFMRVQEQTLDKRRADCRIWAHMLFWWLVPFGWIIVRPKCDTEFLHT